ncbi:luciferase-like monooxygenase family protein [Mycobacterium ulcerans str. Harvey]|uniref:Luciferase-like monooxygenase family protein n=1 Tax=Mycobacterium ulcerans str. Harvey TaxID=1299332 RepID=A0ABP3A2K5_MYCUL|nr:luciferase-like monooxygenase family protein [Mycobacterium ulcerans str. Harvey]
MLPQDFSNMAAVQQGMESGASAAPSQTRTWSAAPPTCIATLPNTWAPAHHDNSEGDRINEGQHRTWRPQFTGLGAGARRGLRSPAQHCGLGMRPGHARARRPGRTTGLRRHLVARALRHTVWHDAQPDSGTELLRRKNRAGQSRHVRGRGALVASHPAGSPDGLPGHHLQREIHDAWHRARGVQGEFAAVGVPREESRQRFNETLDTLALAFSGKRFAYEGEIFTVPEMSLRPEPFSSDLFARIYSSSSTAESLEILARRGMVPLFVGSKPIEDAGREVQQVNTFRQEEGLPPCQPKNVMFMYCTASAEQAAESEEWIWTANRDVTVHYGFADASNFKGVKGYEAYAAREASATAVLASSVTGDAKGGPPKTPVITHRTCSSGRRRRSTTESPLPRRRARSAS